MINVIGVAGSSRKNGNSTTLLRRALAGAAEIGARTTMVRLDDIPIGGCRGCDVCSGGPDSACILQDGMSGLLSALRLADVWLLAFPIYYDMPCGLFKTFFDRCRTLSRVQGERTRSLNGPRRSAIIVTYEDKPCDDYLRVAKTVSGYLNWFGDFGEAALLDGANLGPADAAAQRPDLLQQAERIGARLVSELRTLTAGGV